MINIIVIIIIIVIVVVVFPSIVITVGDCPDGQSIDNIRFGRFVSDIRPAGDLQTTDH